MEIPAKKPRYEFVDLMKGVCIILVVIQHLVGQCAVNPPWLTTFRMPLYFMLSGLFFSSYGSFRVFLLKKVNSLLIPFGVTWLICMAHIYLHYGNLRIDPLKYNVAIWFLIALFEVGIIFYVLCKLPKEWMRGLAALLISVSGYMLNSYHITLPFYLDSAMTATIFYYIGPFIRKMHLLETRNRQTDLVMGLISLFIFGTVAYYYPNKLLDLRLNHVYTPYPVFLLSAVSGTATVFFFCKLIRHVPLVSYWGRYSIVALCTHIFIYRMLQEYGVLSAIQRLFGLSNEVWLQQKVGAWTGVVLVFFLTLPLIWLLIRHIPFLCSQMPLLNPQTGRLYKSPRTLLRIFIKGKREGD